MIQPYYDRAGIVLYNADCLDVLPQLPAQSIDLVLCDLPYGTTDCAWDSIIPLDELWTQYKRVCKPTAALVFTASQPFTSVLTCSNLAWFHTEWIWRKQRGTGHLNADHVPMKAHESVLVFYGNTPTYNPQMRPGTPYKKSSGPGSLVWNQQTKAGWVISLSNGDRYPLSVLDFDIVPNPVHPTQKPLALMEYLIRTYSNPGDLVLDNAFGSGTTLRACKNLGRRCVGMEKDTTEGYCAIAADRLAQEVLALDGAA